MTNTKTLKLASSTIKPVRKMVEGQTGSDGKPVYEHVTKRIKGTVYPMGRIEVLKRFKDKLVSVPLDFPLGVDPQFEALLNQGLIDEEVGNVEVELVLEDFDFDANLTKANIYGDKEEQRDVYAYLKLSASSVRLADKKYYDYLPKEDKSVAQTSTKGGVAN